MSDLAESSFVGLEPTGRVRIVLGESQEQHNWNQLVDDLRLAMVDARAVVLNCNDLAFLPTAVVQILISLQRTCESRGLPFAIEGLSETARAYFRIAGIDAVLVA